MNYVNRYNKAHYDRLIVLVPKGSLAKIRLEALKHGISASEFVRRLIPKSLLTKGETTNDCSGI
jgi:hypothetical protein